MMGFVAQSCKSPSEYDLIGFDLVIHVLLLLPRIRPA